MDFWKIWNRLLGTAFGLVLLVAVGQNVPTWWAQHQEAVRQEQQQERLKTTGADATMTGAMLYGAWRQCRVIGIEDIDGCAKQTGPLLQEQTAAAVAGQAAAQRESYLKNCRAAYADAYCVSLLQRAVAISQNLETMNRSSGH